MSLPLLLVASYLLGSIPFGFLLVRVFKAEDIRESGSGNIGATNVARSSPPLGVLTLLLDAAKGIAAVVLAKVLFPGQTVFAAAAALAAICGHMFPPWLKFRGGKGVATGLGSFVLIAPLSILAATCVFVAVVAASRYVSLASLLAVALIPLLAWRLDRLDATPLGIVAVGSLLVILKHHGNIRRLLTGSENRLTRWGS